MAPSVAGPLRRRILIVDDSAAVRCFIKVLLMGLGFEFVEADDGDRALRLTKLVPSDIVVADIRMPILDGLGFVRSLRGSNDVVLQRLPVVLLSGDRTPGLREAALSAGASVFLFKPVDREVLVDAVEELLQVSGARPTRVAS